MIQVSDDGVSSQNGESGKKRCSWGYILKLYLTGFDDRLRCERKREIKNDSKVFGLSYWNCWVIIRTESLREKQIEGEVYDFDLRNDWVWEAYQTSEGRC